MVDKLRILVFLGACLVAFAAGALEVRLQFDYDSNPRITGYNIYKQTRPIAGGDWGFWETPEFHPLADPGACENDPAKFCITIVPSDVPPEFDIRYKVTHTGMHDGKAVESGYSNEVEIIRLRAPGSLRIIRMQ